MNTKYKDMVGMTIQEGNLLLDPLRNWHKVTYSSDIGHILIELETGMILKLNQMVASQMIIISETEPIPFRN